jgi:hypothetical protein
MNYGSRRLFSPDIIALQPGSGSGQGHVDFLRFVPMARVMGCWSEEQEAARDSCAGELPAESHNLTPSVILEKLRIDVGYRVGLIII